MPTKTIHVRPASIGWTLECAPSVMPLNFFSGGVAELKAHELAKAIVSKGEMAQVLIHDRSGVVVGSFVSGPDQR